MNGRLIFDVAIWDARAQCHCICMAVSVLSPCVPYVIFVCLCILPVCLSVCMALCVCVCKGDVKEFDVF